jgi:hypothetical protein
MGQIFGAVPFRGDVRANAASVLIEGVAGAKCSETAMLAKLAGPVLALELLDRRAISASEGAEVFGIHEDEV